MERRLHAGRVGRGGIAGNRHRLAAAAAPVDLTPLAAAAWLLHPIRSAERVEGRQIRPDLGQRTRSEPFECQRRDRLRGMTGQYGAVRRHHEGVARPATHAGFGIDGEIVRRDEIDVHDAGQPFARCLDDLGLAIDCFAVGHQRIAVGERPAGILHIGDLEPFRAKRKGELDEFRHFLDIVAMDRRIDGERQAGGARTPRRLQLLFVAAAGGCRCARWSRPRALEAQLQMVEPGFGKRLDAAFGDADAGSDQIGVDAAPPKARRSIARGRGAVSARRPRDEPGARRDRRPARTERATSRVSSSRLAFRSSVGLEQYGHCSGQRWVSSASMPIGGRSGSLIASPAVCPTIPAGRR